MNWITLVPVILQILQEILSVVQKPEVQQHLQEAMRHIKEAQAAHEKG